MPCTNCDSCTKTVHDSCNRCSRLRLRGMPTFPSPVELQQFLTTVGSDVPLNEVLAVCIYDSEITIFHTLFDIEEPFIYQENGCCTGYNEGPEHFDTAQQRILQEFIDVCLIGDSEKENALNIEAFLCFYIAYAEQLPAEILLTFAKLTYERLDRESTPTNLTEIQNEGLPVLCQYFGKAMVQELFSWEDNIYPLDILVEAIKRLDAPPTPTPAPQTHAPLSTAPNPEVVAWWTALSPEKKQLLAEWIATHMTEETTENYEYEVYLDLEAQPPTTTEANQLPPIYGEDKNRYDANTDGFTCDVCVEAADPHVEGVNIADHPIIHVWKFHRAVVN